MVRLRAGKFAGTNQPFAFHHAARNGEHQPEMDVCGRLGDNRRNDGNRNAALGRLRDVDVVGRDRHRADMHAVSGWRRARRDRYCRAAAQNRISHFLTAAISFDFAMILLSSVLTFDVRKRAQPLQRAVGDRLGDKDARFGRHRSHRTMPATPSTAHCTPSGIFRVASSTPSTIGMPRSRASEAMMRG